MPLTKNNFESQIQIANWTNANGTLATWKGRATSKSFCGYYLFLLPLNWGKSQKVLFDLITRISTFSSISHHISIFIFKSHFFFSQLVDVIINNNGGQFSQQCFNFNHSFPIINSLAISYYFTGIISNPIEKWVNYKL